MKLDFKKINFVRQNLHYILAVIVIILLVCVSYFDVGFQFGERRLFVEDRKIQKEFTLVEKTDILDSLTETKKIDLTKVEKKETLNPDSDLTTKEKMDILDSLMNK